MSHVELPGPKFPKRDPPFSVMRPSSTAWPWLALAVVLLAAPLCVGLTALGAQHFDLLHVTFFNGCTSRAYEFHLQDQRRYPDPIRFDFVKSLESFVLVVIWLDDGPTLTFGEGLPLHCSTAQINRPTSGGMMMK